MLASAGASDRLPRLPNSRVAVVAKPVGAVVVSLVGETHRNAVVAEGPDFLDEPVIEFTLPFPRQIRFRPA
jgi:hypothetical protein